MLVSVLVASTTATRTEGDDQIPTPAPAAPATTEENDAELMAALEKAADADKTTLETTKGSDATNRNDQEKSDPINQLPEGAKRVIGNEANPSLSIILDTAFAYFTENDRYRMGGHAPTGTGPAIQGAELAASASIDPYFRLDMAFGLYHLHMEEVYATTTSLPWNLQLRAGKFKSDIGRHNPTHLHTWHFVVHPIANEFLFGAEGMSLPGGELSFLFPIPWYMELKGALQMGEAGMFRTDTSGDPSFKDFVYPLRLVQFFDIGDDVALQVGLNSVFAPSTIGPESGNRSYAYGADLMFKWRPIGEGRTGYTFIAWTIEGWFREMEVPDDIWRDAGGYTDLVFGIHKRWEAALRGELWRSVSGGSVADDIERARFGADTLRGSAAVSFMPSHFSRVRLQYAIEDMDGYDLSQSIFLQLEVSAGAHGAHKY